MGWGAGFSSLQYEPLSSQRYAEKAKNALRTPRPLRFKVHTNPQGWLPLAALTGCGGRGGGRGAATCILFIIYFNCCRQLTTIASTSHPRTVGYPCIHVAPKSSCQPPHHKSRWCRSGTGTRYNKGEGVAEVSRLM